jgi:hypothetical protein
VLNRAGAKSPANKGGGQAAETAGNEQELASKAEGEVQNYRVLNRCSYEEARNAVRRVKPELFGIKTK